MTTTQYDAIGAKYMMMKQLPTARLERSNLHAAIADHIKGARVLDLACGAGYYSRLLLEWGAASVVGVDISPAMVAAAQHEAQSLSPDTASRMSFRVGDAINVGKIDPKGFDLALGPWLLNYAGTEDELTAMFSTISANLNGPGAIFAGITPPPVKGADMDAFAAWANSTAAQDKMRGVTRVTQSYYQRNERMPEGEGGWRVEVTALDEKGGAAVQFRNYHLPVEVYERAMKGGGMEGRVEWLEVKLRDDVREESVAEFGEELFKTYLEDMGAHFGVLVVAKGTDDDSSSLGV
ncbi:hypothetical protein OQA88_6976 [Cercophora sp. LCS_1]